MSRGIFAARHRQLSAERTGLTIRRLLTPTAFKIVASLLVVTAITGAGIFTSLHANAADTPVTPPDSCFVFTAGTGTITDYYDTEGNVAGATACSRAIDIPSTIGGVAVTTIGSMAFYVNQLTAVTIPNSVTSIGDSAFVLNQLTAITIPDSVTNIGRWAFNSNQLTAITIPDSVTSIGDSAFSGNQLTSVAIPASVTIAGKSIFAGNPITSISYAGATHTPEEANDDGCYINVGGSVTGFDRGNLRSIMNGGSPCLNSALAIPSVLNGQEISNISSYAFSMGHFTSVSIPNTVTSIGEAAFFSNDLKTLVLGDSVTSIGDSAFFVNDLKFLTIPRSVVSIGTNAFAANPIASIEIGAISAIQSIADSAFSITSATSVTYDNVIHDANEPNDDACFIFNPTTGTVTGFKRVNIISVVAGGSACLGSQLAIPTTIDGTPVTSIGDSAFSYNQLTSVTIPDSVTSIGDSAFSSNQLTSVAIPDSVTSIGDSAFSYNQLTSVTIPDSVTSIDNSTFLGNPLASAIISDPALASLFSSDPAVGFDSAFVSCILAIVPAPTDLLEYVPCFNDTLASSSGTFFRLYIPGGSTDADSIVAAQETIYSSALGLPAPTLIGGTLTNPASVILKYVDQDGREIKAPEQRTGFRSSDGEPLTSYSIADSGMDAPVDPANPTMAETAAMTAGFAQYFRIGQTETFSAPAITGYTTPGSQTVTLDSGDNVVTFTYQAIATPGTSSGDTPGAPNTGINPESALAETGTNAWLFSSVAGVLVFLGACAARVIVRRR